MSPSSCKRILPILIYLITALCACHDSPTIHTIALQPIETHNSQELYYIRGELSRFFHHPVIILDEIKFPSSFLNTSKGERYNADSIIQLLSKRKSDTLTQIIGFTGKDIFIADKDSKGHIKEPKYKYEVWGIFGLGACPGRASIVSTFRLQTADTLLFKKRLRTVVLHEIGHTLGLPHCPTPGCIMNDANERISTIDNSSEDYCPLCRARLSAP